jgi:hypothetical protein
MVLEGMDNGRSVGEKSLDRKNNHAKVRNWNRVLVDSNDIGSGNPQSP